MYLSIFMKYRHEFIAPCKGVRIPESGKILLVESGILQGPVVRRPISANSGLNFNPGLFFFSSKAFSLALFSILVRVGNHQIVGKKEFN